MYDFGFERPQSLADASAALAADAEATIIAGGQTLLPTLRQRLARPSKLVDLGAIEGLQGISRDGNTLTIGAMTTHAEIARSGEVAAAIPAVASLAGMIGDPQVRHRGTIGGSLANNDPAADWPAAALALNATIETDRRRIVADQYFQGLFQTALEPGEIIKAVHFPVPQKAGYSKFEQRASRYALVGVFVTKSELGIRVAVTGAAEGGVFLAEDLEARLASDFSITALSGAQQSDDGLQSDLHGSAAYRATLIPVVAERAVAAAG